MTAKTLAKKAFKLGQAVFAVESNDLEAIDYLSNFLPQASEEENSPEIAIIPAQFYKDIRGLGNHILKQHSNCFWLDAACLISPSGKKLLLCGRSQAGKSTLAMALSIGYGWSLLSEDIGLIDASTGKIISFLSPFSLKQGTLQILRRAIGTAPTEIYEREWVPAIQFAVKEGSYYVPFDVAIYLELSHNGADITGADITCTSVQPAEFIHRLLPISNIVSRTGGAEKFFSYLESGKCHRIVNGTLPDRIEFIHNACGEDYQPIWVNPDSENVEEIADVDTTISFSVDQSSRCRRMPGIMTTMLPDGHCVLKLETEHWAVTITPAAAVIWELCDGEHSIAQILGELEQMPFQSGSDIKDLLSATIEQFSKEGLIELV